MGHIVTMARALGVVLAAQVLVTSAMAQSGASRDATALRPVRVLPILELYTSQGCSSCPPADRLMETYAKRNDLVAISLSVDYWDYMGWKDTNAKAAFSSRQREYARARGDGQVYTPQAVVNGLDHAVGSDRSGIDAALARTLAEVRTNRIALAVAADGSALHLTLASGAPMPRPCIVWIATVKPEVTVAIERGENRGREVTYHNVVKDMARVGTWTGATTTLPLESVRPGGPLRHVAIVQDGKGGPALAAAWLD